MSVSRKWPNMTGDSPKFVSRWQCPATMCPLVANDGSPWTKEYAAPCPGHDALGHGGCPWWSMACATGGIQGLVEQAARGHAIPVVGPNQPRHFNRVAPRSYDCPKAGECRWQQLAEIDGLPLCPPRNALARGIDPRVCLF